MSNSAASSGEATPLEDFTENTSFSVSTPIGDVQYRVEKTPEGVFHHESLKDPVLGTIYDQQVQIDYWVGSGRHGRSYIFAVNDCLFMSPITWYSEQSQWALSPNYRPERNPRFERRILQGCLVCHTERISVNREAPHHFSAPVMLAAKISCESCHGPGKSHVEFHERRSDSTEPATDPIIEPTKLDSERRESVCWQCHLSGEERITRYGRLDSDFRPGMSFNDVWIAFVRGTHRDEEGSMRVAGHVEQTQSSVCYQKSAGRFGCLSCHDAHGAPSNQEKVGFYREKCMACHEDRGCSVPLADRISTSAEDSCIACHMPSHGLNRIPHTSRTDHRILRRPEPETDTNHDRPLSIFNPSHHKLPAIEEDRAWGLVLAKMAYLNQDAEIARVAEQKLASVLSAVPDDNRVLEWLGVCEQLLNRPARALERWEQILGRLPQDEGALQRIAELRLTQSNPMATKRALTDYLNVNPWQSGYQLRLAAVNGSEGNLDEAARCANEALRINPTLSSAYQILAEVYRRRNQQDLADKHDKLRQRLEPRKPGGQ